MNADGGLLPLLLFFLFHFLAGLVLPRRKNAPPFLYTFFRSAGGEIDRRLNRDTRAPGDLFLRGAVALFLLAAAGLLAGYAVQWLAQLPYGWIAVVLFLNLAAALMGPLELVRGVAKALAGSDTAGAASLLQPHFPELLEKADAPGLARRAAEWSAVSLTAHFTGPLFWFLLAGAPGAAVYVVIAAAREAFGANDAEHAFFGSAVRFFDRLFSIVPALLTAALVSLAAVFVSRASPLRALATALEQGRRYRSGVFGAPVAAMAGALGITLGGPPHGWIGPEGSSAKVFAGDLERCAMIHFVCFLCGMMLVSASILLSSVYIY